MSAKRGTNKIISLDIDSTGYMEAMERIIFLGKTSAPSYACFANVHMAIEAYKDKLFADQVNKADLVLADGMPLVKALKFFYKEKQDRIAGMDAMPDLIKLAGDHNLKIFFFGTTQETLDKIRNRIQKEHPSVHIAGLLSPPFGKSLNDATYIDEINGSGANLVFVALGCPKQEKWMAENSSKINAVLLGVGGAFPLYAGMTDRAPLWMRNLSLEWLYRLFQEPSRLFMRYLKTNSLFIYLILKIKLKNILAQ